MGETKNVRYHLLAGLMLVDSVDRIVAGLVRREFTVSPAGGAGNVFISNEGNMTVILALDIAKKVAVEPSKDARAAVLAEVRAIIDEAKIKCYMLVLVNEGASMCWQLGNVVKSSEQPPTQLPTNPKNLN